MPHTEGDSPKYQLVAIMFTDMVGFSGKMGTDEHQTLQLIRKNREIHKRLIKKHRGRWLKEMGDGTMSSFSTASNSIECALEIQRELKAIPDLKVRIGIHLGEVIEEEEDIFGDGVNIAARLESVADPGGIYISDTVQRSIRSKQHITTRYLGELSLKNIDVPVKVFALVDEHLPVPRVRNLNRSSRRKRIWYLSIFLFSVVIILTSLLVIYWYGKRSSNLSGPPEYTLDSTMVAVFPFTVKGNEELNYLSEGMVDLISVKLDDMPDFKALDPNIVIANFKDRETTDYSPAELIKMAEEWGAGRIIIGNIIQIGDIFRIRISYYNSPSAPLHNAEIVLEETEDLISGIDQLVKETVAQELVSEGFEMEGLAAYTSENMAALKSYLEGESLRRKGEYDLANNKFMESIQLDSTMCLSWLRLWQTCTWKNICPSSADDILSMVKHYSDNLPQKLKGYVEAMVAYYNSSPDAERQFRDLIRTYGENVDLLIGLGEVLYHSNEMKGRMASEALPYFLQAWDYDPDNNEVLPHLIELLAYEQDTLQLERIVKHIPYSSDFWYAHQSVYLLSVQSEWSDEQLAQILEHPDFDWPDLFNRCNIESLLFRFVQFKQDLERIRGRSFPQSDMQPFDAIISIWQGKEAQAAEILANHPARAILFYIMPLVNTFDPFSYFENNSFINPDLLQSGRVSGPYPDDFILALHALDPYQAPEFEKYFQSLEKWMGTQDNPPYFLAEYLRALYLRKIGKFEASNQVLSQMMDKGHIYLPGPLMNFFTGSLLFTCAENHYDLEEYEESLHWYQVRFNSLGAGDEFMIGFSFLKRAELCKRTGQLQEAIQYYDRFLDLYRQCDMKYQLWVEKAETERSRIMGKILQDEYTSK